MYLSIYILYPLLNTRVRALKYYKSTVYKSSFKHILTPGIQMFPNPFPSPSKQIPAGPRERGNGQRGALVGTFGSKAEDWLLETRYILQTLINLQKCPCHGQYSQDVPGTLFLGTAAGLTRGCAQIFSLAPATAELPRPSQAG